MAEPAQTWHRGTYFDASLRRISVAGLVLGQEQHGLTLFLCGVAAECMLIAYSPSGIWEQSHNLKILAGKADLLDRLSPSARQDVSAAVGLLHSVWRNNHRYRGERALNTFLVKKVQNRYRVNKGSKDAALIRAANEAYEAANKIVSHGALKWKTRS